jgi:hypothetical protein
MYLWKYWRESRIALAVGMVLVGLLLLGVCVHHVGPPLHGRFREQLNPDQIYLVVTSFLTLPLGFLALGFGSFGVGRDLGEGSGSFVLSRPRARASFVWSDWGFGMAQLLLIILAANLVVAWAAHHIAATSGPIYTADGTLSMLSIFSVDCVAGLLLAGLIFGLTYFASVLVKSRGVLLTLGVVATYLIGKQVVKYYWPGVNLPELTLSEFSVTHAMIISFAGGLGWSIALRAALVMAFPVAAQILVQRRDVD